MLVRYVGQVGMKDSISGSVSKCLSVDTRANHIRYFNSRYTPVEKNVGLLMACVQYL